MSKMKISLTSYFENIEMNKYIFAAMEIKANSVEITLGMHLILGQEKIEYGVSDCKPTLMFYVNLNK